MTEILCKWINDNNKFGEQIEADEFPTKFSNGYLFGQILYQYGLQPDFGQFSKANTSEAKLNNFMRLEPTFRHLSISFNSNMANSVMTEKQGAATRLMYQIFVALHRKEKVHLASQSIDSVRSDGKFKLEQIESNMFQENLKLQTPRQVDLNFEELIKKFKGRHEKYKALLMKERVDEEEKLQQARKEACQKALDKSRGIRDAHRQLYARLKPVELLSDKPAKETRSIRSLSSQQKAVAEEVKKSIDLFEETQKNQVQTTPYQRPRPATTGDVTSPMMPATSGDGLAATPTSDEYLASIHQRVKDDAMARKEREKRRRKVLIDQMKSLQEQEESRRGEMLVNRLMRQCQQERRIATQLMQIRKAKDVIRRNRVAQLQQYEERRLKEFEDALNREAILAQQREDEKRVQLREAKELHDQLQAKKAEERYKKHYALCWDVLLQILDLATRIGEYKELAQGLVPAKVVRNWKVMVINGNPLYEDQCEPEPPDVKVVDVTPRMALLNDNDFWEYRNTTGEWECSEEIQSMFPGSGNNVLSHVVYHLHELHNPAKPCRPVSSLPNFSLKACCIGKPFAGKSTILKKVSKVHKLTILLPDQLVQKAVSAYFKEKNELDMMRPGNSFNLDESTEVTDDNNTPRPFIEVQPSSTTDVSLADKSVESMAAPPSKVDSDRGLDTCDETRSSDNTPGPGMAGSVEKQDSVETTSGQFSPLASLGQAAECAMLGGQAVDDVTIIDIILHELKALPEKSGWVIESFPATLNQAQLLDKALSGFEPPAPPPKLATMLAGVQGHYLLIPKPIPSTEPNPPQSGFDVVLYFDVTSDEVFKRTSNDDGGSDEGMSDQPIDTKKNQIQNRLLAFEDNWVLLETWFSQFNNLVLVDANGNEAATQKFVSSKIKELKKDQQPNANTRRASVAKQALNKKVLESESLVMAAKSASDQAVSASATTPSVADSSSTALAVTTGDQPSVTTAAPDTDDGKKSPEPGSPDWVYADLPVPEEIVKALTPKWSAIESSYIKASKHVFQMIRDEQETHCYYFYDRRMEIITYLKRPDLKQELLTTWQSNYNSIPDNLRNEAIMIAEQHQCVDDLCAALWDICDRRRDDAEKERVRIMEDNWTDDHSGMIVNHCISLMQCEFNKFQDTVQLLNDYYFSFDDPVPLPVPDRNAKLPLIELPDKEPQELLASAVGSQTTVEQQDDNKDDNATDDSAALATAAPAIESRDSRSLAASKQQIQEKKPEKKVLLIPRSMPPPETEEKGKKKAHTESPTQVLEGIELDEVLLNHAIKTANKYITSVVDALVKKQASAVEPVVNDGSTSAAAEKEKVDEKGKGGKGDAKKGKDKGDKKSSITLQKANSSKKVDRASPVKSPVEDPTKSLMSVPEVPTSEKAKSKQELTRNEHLAAVKHEEQETKARLELIKSYALEKIQHIMKAADEMYTEMGEWIEMSYKQECESVSHLAEILKQSIENEQQLLQEIKMPYKELQIDMSVLMMELPAPPRPDTPNEPSTYDQFTVVQLITLYQQLRSIAPNGVVMYKILVDTMYSLSHASYGSDNLPDSWTDLTPKQMDELLQMIYPDASEYVDWHTLLVTLAQPYPIPSTQDLLNALNSYRTITNGDVLMSRDQYDKVELWLTTSVSSSVNLPQLTCDRYSYLKHVLFDMFADPDSGKLDYLKMLLHFSADHDSRSGLFKAMSLLCGSEVDPNNTEGDNELSVELVCQLLTVGLDQEYLAALQQEIESIFTELNPTESQNININVLLSHPVMAQKFNNCSRFLLADLTPHYHRCASPTVEQSSDTASH